MSPATRFFILATSLLLNACGGGTSGSQSTQRSPNALGGPAPDPTVTVSLMTEPGSYVDTDTNEQHLFSRSNNSFNEAQQLTAPSKTLGFLNQQSSTSAFDTFNNQQDPVDVFSVSLEQDDQVILRAFNAGNEVDLDLFLFDETGELIKSSTTRQPLEMVQIDNKGRYFILVEARDTGTVYTSKYELILAPKVSLAFAPTTNQRANFTLDSALVSQSQLLPPFKAPKQQVNLEVLNTEATTYAQLAGDVKGFLGSLYRLNKKGFLQYQTLKAIQTLSQRDENKRAEPNFHTKLQSTPNDPFYAYQWYIDAINFPEALVTAKTVSKNDNLIIAVIDSGIYLAHEELEGRLLPGYDFIQDPALACDGDGLDNDPNDPGDNQFLGAGSYHGTHVAGIIAANTNNNIGIAGLNEQIAIMPLRVVGCGDGNQYDLIQALRYAASLSNDSGTLPDKPADIINISLGTDGFSASLQQLINDISAQGIIIVAAAGNDESNSPSYPAAYQNVIAVSATGSTGKPAPYTNYGNYVDIAAPGGDFSLDNNEDGVLDGILSLSSDVLDGRLQSTYRQYQGTSMATPIVSSTLALMKSITPNLSVAKVQQYLASGNMTKLQRVHSEFTGFGILDANKAVNRAINSPESETAWLSLSDYRLYLNRYDTIATFDVRSTGQPSAASITNIWVDAPWLSVTPLETTGEGIGTYQVQVDTLGLTNTTYEAEVELQTSTGNRLRLLVIANLKENSNITYHAGLLWLLIVDPDDLDVLSSVPVLPSQQGYLVDLGALALQGEYLLVAGSDIDGNGLFCEPGELCGAYPDFATPEPILFDGSQQHIRITLHSHSEALSTSKTSDTHQTTFHRPSAQGLHSLDD